MDGVDYFQKLSIKLKLLWILKAIDNKQITQILEVINYSNFPSL